MNDQELPEPDEPTVWVVQIYQSHVVAVCSDYTKAFDCKRKLLSERAKEGRPLEARDVVIEEITIDGD